jgi:hypothetical protein
VTISATTNGGKRVTSLIVALGVARRAHRLRLQRRHERCGDDLDDGFEATSSSVTPTTDPSYHPTIDPADVTAEITNPNFAPPVQPHQLSAAPNPGTTPQPPKRSHE